MKTFEVKMTIVLTDDAKHPRTWFADVVNANLFDKEGEHILDYDVNEVENKVDDTN